MDLRNFTYDVLTQDVLNRFYEEGKQINKIGTYEDFLKLPIVNKPDNVCDELKTDYELPQIEKPKQ